MIDNFALAISHGVIILAAWRLLWRADLDDDSAPDAAPARPFLRRRKPETDGA
jgi:hypothetical protein